MKVKLLNYATALGVFFAFIQQSIVAVSIIIIANLSESIATGSGFILWLCLYGISLTVVYIPTTLVNYFFNKAKYITYEDYIITFADQTIGQIEHFFSSNSREKEEAYFTHEAWMIIDEDYDFLKDMAHLVFNIVLSVLILSYLINKALIIAYALAIPLTVICILCLKHLVEKRSDAAQKNRSRLMQMLSPGWDTILIGNVHNLSVWKSSFRKKCSESADATRKLDLTLDLSAFGMVVISAAPVLVVIGFSFYDAVGDIALLTLLVATTPRQLGTVQYLSDAINLFVNLNDKIRRTRQLSENLSLEMRPATSGKITWNSIYLTSKDGRFKLNGFEDLLIHTNNYSNGRYTITGDNGSGKTTVLAKLKLDLKNKAYLLPNKSKMFFFNDLEQKEASAGEKTSENLHEIFSNLRSDGVTVLLLDEWSANLDLDNFRKLSKTIDEVSRDFCVIEVVHKLASNHVED
ncbi:hypothetical protein HCH52_05620 [Oscillospiraceae bacterium HV4-5-C5C]|nr:hypothetical protein [Oscillospiraceae bacterium HV4-5-C5C]